MKKIKSISVICLLLFLVATMLYLVSYSDSDSPKRDKFDENSFEDKVDAYARGHSYMCFEDDSKENVDYEKVLTCSEHLKQLSRQIIHILGYLSWSSVMEILKDLPNSLVDRFKSLHQQFIDRTRDKKRQVRGLIMN